MSDNGWFWLFMSIAAIAYAFTMLHMEPHDIQMKKVELQASQIELQRKQVELEMFKLTNAVNQVEKRKE